MTTITLLVENRVLPTHPALRSEHGLSLWVESDGVRLLVDTGADGAFAENAKELGIDISTADMVVLSHAHRDHTGGVVSLAEARCLAPIFIAPELLTTRCYSRRGGQRHDISAPKLDGVAQLVSVEAPYSRVGECYLFYAKDYGYPTPSANRYLSAESDGVESADRFTHEISLALTTSKGLVILSPCSHSGAANIIATAKELTGESSVVAFVGGLHLPDEDGVEEEATMVARALMEVAPQAVIYTGHCTSDRAIARLEELLPNLLRLHTGLKINL